MKHNLLKSIIATTLGLTTASSCGVERGVIVYKQNIAEERALYVNLIHEMHLGGKSDKNTIALDSLNFSADRKLFFDDAKYANSFTYLLAGDTIVFRNKRHETYVDINKKNKILKINGSRER